ncbi:MAG: hypothetical protein F7C07_00580 [Desulfurococcales archaeon]|nr:hypothetical protein [Desulfurococcales archaeon]
MLSAKWAAYKELVIREILEDSIIGYLDPGILELLLRINSVEGLATTSSCTGRITIIEGEKHWDRSASRIVYKTHTEASVEKLSRILEGPFDNLWLKVSGPILHLRTVSLECAQHVLGKARLHGFKHSGIASVKLEEVGGIVVELMSSIDVAAPLKVNGVVLIDPQRTAKIVETANKFLAEGKRKLEELVSDLTMNPGPCGAYLSQS